MVSEPPDELEYVKSLAESLGWSGKITLTRLHHGGNNRSYHLNVGEHAALAKFYFRDEADPRDRLAVEWAFTRFAWRAGIRTAPQPLARDEVNGLALYEFIEGAPFTTDQVDRAAVMEASRFYRELNTPERRAQALDLPAASEACFTLAEHSRRIQQRVDRLAAIDLAHPIDRQAAMFVADELAPAWREVRDALGSYDEADGPVERRLSPSDFGFHNAIRGGDGRLRFIDFEYAGWDDPAKLVCDFYCQPKHPAPWDTFGAFAEAIAADLLDPAAQVRRIRALMPAYRIKWCCIMLNEFLPVGLKRRQFAGADSDVANRKSEQIVRARAALATVDKTGPLKEEE